MSTCSIVGNIKVYIFGKSSNCHEHCQISCESLNFHEKSHNFHGKTHNFRGFYTNFHGMY